MAILPVNAIFSGMQKDGHWAGSPALIIHLMEHPDASVPPFESLDGSYPLTEWDMDPANEVSLNKLLTRRAGSAHFAYVGASTLSMVACSYREKHVLIVGREPGHYDLAPLAKLLVEAGRHVQVQTTIMMQSLVIPNVWVSLFALPSGAAAAPAELSTLRPNEVVACIRWKSDLDRVEASYAQSSALIWLRPSSYAEAGIYRQCIAVATRHAGWRVIGAVSQPALAHG